MIRRISLLVVSIGLVAGLIAAAADATFVLKSGERHSGQLVYHGTDKVSLVINGQERAFPFDDIALIAFAGVDPTRQEIDQLPTSNNPPELEMHMLVFRDGRTLKGKLHDFKGDMISFDTRTEGGSVDRRQIPMNQVSRLYMSAPASRSLFGNAPTGGTTPPAEAGRRTVKVEGNRAWTDTGLDVRRGDRITFTASGRIRIGNEEAGPNGSSERSARLSIPVRALNVGGLIGRVGNSAPFAIGDRSEPVVMRANGRLFLGVNDDHLEDNSGFFEVIVSR